ncbi:MAG: hypothetical protein QGI13_17075, partial [Rhodospirillales bacterium]|nr:hypothetical protein [Rhodospirillales bacterium]
ADRDQDIKSANQRIEAVRLTWTLILVSIGSVLVWGCGLLLIFLGEQFLETTGVIPRLWGANNMGSIVVVSTLFSAPFILLLIIGLFHRTKDKTESEPQPPARGGTGSARPATPSRADEPGP